MADISKCSGNNCKVRLSCRRYTAPSGEWQSWAEFWKNSNGYKCPDYWEWPPKSEVTD